MIEIPLSDFQEEMIKDPTRFKVAVCGRRSGKTTIARVKAYIHALENPGSFIWIVAKTYSQVESLYWDALVGSGRPVGVGRGQKLIPDKLIENTWRSSHTIKLINGSVIQLKGADNPDSLLGEGLDLLILDEFQSQNPKVWYMLYPMVSDTGGEIWVIGTPRGLNHFYDLFEYGNENSIFKLDNWKSWQVTTEEAGQVPQEELEIAKQTLSPKEFRQEYLASFENMSGQVYSEFDEENISKDISVSPINDAGRHIDVPLLVGMDFNVNPMCAVVGVRMNNELWIGDEIKLENSNTREMIQEIKRRYPNRRIFVYPDPSGSRRQTSSSSTDHQLLQDAGFKIRARKSHPAIRDRINCVNALLNNANGERRLFVHSSCSNLIKTFKGLVYDENGQPDKSSGLDHMSDALGYLVEFEFPINKSGAIHPM